MAERDVVGDQPVLVLSERCPASEDEAAARFERDPDVAKGRHRVGEEHDAHARSRDIERGPLERKRLRVPEQQGDIVCPGLADSLPGGVEHRL